MYTILTSSFEEDLKSLLITYQEKISKEKLINVLSMINSTLITSELRNLIIPFSNGGITYDKLKKTIVKN